jgi:glucosamine-6-phosphate deaminase
VPTHAITLTIPALLAAKRVLAIVPEARKADAVYCSLRGPVSEACPGSILRRTAHAQLFLDKDSAAKL